ncbi:MAG: site-specific integrase [Pseudomonadota bacterium]|nr:site-specific integrase [Pseudomonadota bacterium]
MAQHELMGGKLHVYKRNNSNYWQCSTYLGGRNHRTSTKEEGIAQAKDFAEDWYLELKGKHKRGEIRHGKTFAEVAPQFIREFTLMTAGQRNAHYVKQQSTRLNKYLLPFFGNKLLSEITPTLVQEYRIDRHLKTIEKQKKLTAENQGKPSPEIQVKPPARQTINQEIVTLRHVLKTANRNGWLPFLPDISEPFRGSRKISHRAWFSPEEYKTLFTATRDRAQNPKQPQYSWECNQLHDYVLFMANTGLRPDEAARLEFRDVAIVTDEATGERILEIEVSGKRGVGYCKSTTGAVLPFQRLKNRERPLTKAEILAGKLAEKPKSEDKVFPISHHRLFTKILIETNLRFDRQKNPRTSYSLRHTYS